MKYKPFLPYQGLSPFWKRRISDAPLGMTPWAIPDPRYKTVPQARAKRNFYKWYARPQKSYMLFWRTHPELVAKMELKSREK